MKIGGEQTAVVTERTHCVPTGVGEGAWRVLKKKTFLIFDRVTNIFISDYLLDKINIGHD